MINFMMILTAIACFVYGIYVLTTGRLLGNGMEGVAEKNKQRFSKICGAVMIAEAIVVGVGFYMETTERSYSRMLCIGVIGILFCAVWISKKILSKLQL